MTLDTAFLRSKVARRIFALFILSAVVPIATLALLIFRQVETELDAQTAWRLHSESKTTGIAIHERLVSLQNDLSALARAAAEHPGAVPPRGGGTNSPFTTVTEGPMAGRTIPHLGRAPPLTARQRHHLRAGRTLLTTLAGADGRAVILLRRLIDPRRPVRGVIAATIDPARLTQYGPGDDQILTVLDGTGRPLYSSAPLPVRAAATAAQSARHAVSGQLDWQGDGAAYRAGFWNLFLMPDFLAPHWTIVISMPKGEALARLDQFRRIFPPVIALSLFMVSLLSVILIRRHLVPLESLREAAVKAGNRDFAGANVTVTSGDEFEELARAFNAMARRLDRQFRALSAMAELDRSILSALDADYIIETLLRRIPEVVPCDLVLVAVLDRHDGATARLHMAGARQETEPSQCPVSLTTREIKALRGNRVLHIGPEQGDPPGYLLPLRQAGANHFMVFPIELRDELAGVIGLAFRHAPALDAEDIDQTRELAGRIAVALSNAAWEEKLYHHAHYDALTDLPNRMLLKDRLEQALARAERSDLAVAVLFIDLDRFKDVNDSLGHRAGDELLILVARALAGCLRGTDTVVRLGGDEFTVIIPDMPRDMDVFPAVNSIAKQLQASLARPFQVAGHEMRVTASMGIAIYPRDAGNYDDMLRNADSAMYHAKDRGKDNYQFYSDSLNARTLERLQTENDLRRALEKGELQLYYQPQVCTRTGRVVGAEALLRWQHPEKGMISPATFIPIAEATGLIVPIGEWVLQTACDQAMRWQRQGLKPPRVAVNISARQFIQPNLVEQVEHALAVSGLDPHSLEVEITESTTMDSAENTVTTLQRLKDVGVHMSIDDFGTGYSSLSYLKRFPVDYLKIDHAFVRPIPGDAESLCIVNAVIALAHGLNLTVIAEGVETAEQYDLLQERGCEIVQGYYISRPIPADEFAERFLLEGQPVA